MLALIRMQPGHHLLGVTIVVIDRVSLWLACIDDEDITMPSYLGSKRIVHNRTWLLAEERAKKKLVESGGCEPIVVVLHPREPTGFSSNMAGSSFIFLPL